VRTLDLSVVIVSYRCLGLLRRCLATVRSGMAPLTGEVIVVDNHSQDGTIEMVRAEFPWVTLLASTQNLGFAAGNNLGLGQARGEYLALLNPDTECHEGSLARLVEVLRGDAGLGMAAPRLLNPDGTLQPSIRRLPTFGVALLVLAKVYRLVRHFPAVRRYDAAAFDYDCAQDVEQPMGACMVLPRRVLDQVGALDERFWMWFEEVDLCRRVLGAGWRIRYVPDARVVHALGVSSKQLKMLLRHQRYADSMLKYFAKHQPGWRVPVLQVAAAIGNLTTWIAERSLAVAGGRDMPPRLGAKDIR
jgi:N-acetylglucosaminyl-diphospho-decaprenol L-rhamnosyltransferase